MRLSLRTTAAAGLATLLISGLTACDDEPEARPSGSRDVPQAASSSAGSDGSPFFSDAGSSDAATASQDSGQAAGTSLSKGDITQILANSATAFSTASTHLVMDMEANGQKVKVVADGKLQLKPMAQSMTIDMGPMAMEMRLVDNSMYVKSPMLPTGDKWIRMRLDDLGSLGMGDLGDMLNDPTALTTQYATFITSAEYVGEETVAGARVKHYTATMDVKGILAQAKIPGASGVDFPKSATQDIWIDEQGRTVKMTQDMAPLQTMTMTLSDFDEPVDIKAPPASQVTELPKGALSGVQG